MSTWTNLKSDVDKFFYRVASTIFKMKYYEKLWQAGLHNKGPTADIVMMIAQYTVNIFTLVAENN